MTIVLLSCSTQRFQGFVACVIGGAGLMGLALFVFLPMVRSSSCAFLVALCLADIWRAACRGWSCFRCLCSQRSLP